MRSFNIMLALAITALLVSSTQAQLPLTGAGRAGGGFPGGGCGTINLANGCVQPMLGGL
jgi:hypothetical protein